MTPGPAVLGRLRDELLDQVLGGLRSDPSVEGVALVGSLGRGQADNWSDVDLLILMDGRAVARFAEDPSATTWARAELVVDGRHNSPMGATSVGATHIRAGLPVHVDLHVHPVERSSWPADGRVVFQRGAVETGALSFDQLNGSGPRQAATEKTADEVRRIHLSYVPVAGKYVARRVPEAERMIRFLGGPAELAAGVPAVQVRALRGIADDLNDPSWRWLSDAVGAYLDLVEAAAKMD